MLVSIARLKLIRVACWLSICFLSLPILAQENSVGEKQGPANQVEPQKETSDSEFLNAAIAEYSAAMEASGRDARMAAFGRAEQLFAQVIESQRNSGRVPSASLLVNLGNSAMQAGNVGNAIVAFRYALAIEPGNGQARQNLSFARSSLPDWAQRSDEMALVDTLFFWRTLFTKDQVMAVMGGLFFLAALLVAIGIAYQRGLVRNLAILPLLLWCVLLFSVLLDRANDRSEGVVITEFTMLHSADSENSPIRLADPLPDGTEVEILQERERWTEVKIAGKSGWIRSNALNAID